VIRTVLPHRPRARRPQPVHPGHAPGSDPL